MSDKNKTLKELNKECQAIWRDILKGVQELREEKDYKPLNLFRAEEVKLLPVPLKLK